MKENNSKKLFTDFPQLFEDDFMRERGFECKDGWFNLIYDLATALTELPNADKIRVTQVKQKMGRLIFRVKPINDEIDQLVTQAMNKSKVTCELCGSDNSVVRVCKRWHIVLCDYCSSLGDNKYDCLTYDEYLKKRDKEWSPSKFLHLTRL